MHCDLNSRATFEFLSGLKPLRIGEAKDDLILIGPQRKTCFSLGLYCGVIIRQTANGCTKGVCKTIKNTTKEVHYNTLTEIC